MRRQERPTTSDSTISSIPTAQPDDFSFSESACAPQTRRLLAWGCLAVWVVLVGGALSLWWAARVIPLALEDKATPRGSLVSSTTYGPEWIILRHRNLRPPQLRLRNYSRAQPTTESGCYPDDGFGSFCDYVGCSSREAAAKSILLWNARWVFDGQWDAEDDASGLLKCTPNDCIVSQEDSLAPPEAHDAVLLNVDSMNLFNLPTVRSCSQRYVFLMVQFPKDSENLLTSRLRYPVNWTMTFNMDSDVPLPVGRVMPKAGVQVPQQGWMQPQDPPISYSDYSAQDSKIEKSTVSKAVVTWVTECLRGNETTVKRVKSYMRSLSAYMNVHVYRMDVDFWSKENWLEFYDSLVYLKYKFYFVFEFPKCNHFVASHLFRVLQFDTVPVVFGSANYSAVLPPYSYIHGGDLRNPDRLAAYLTFLLNHPMEYTKFFWWKKYYESEIDTKRNLCQLCSKLHADHLPKSYKYPIDWMINNRF